MIAKYLIGKDGAPPFLVNLARGAVEVAVLAAIAFLTQQAELIEWGDKAFIGVGSLWGLSRLAGLADQFIDPSQNRATAARGARIGTGDQGGPPSPQLAERGQSTIHIALAVLIILIFLIVAGIITVR